MLSSHLTRYGVAVGAAALAIAVRFALNPILGERTIPYLMVIAVLPFVGFYAGLRPAIVAFVLGGAGAWYLFVPPTYDFWPLAPSDAAALVFYLIVGAACVALGEVAGRSKFRAEEASRASGANEAQLASLFDVTNVGMTEADAATRRLTRVNPAFCAMTGYDERELLTMTVDDLNHPDDRAQDRELYGRLLRGESAYETEKRYVRKDGRPMWAAVNGDIVRDRDGQPLRAFAVVRDLTARKLAEQDRAAARAQFDALVEHAPIGIALFDPELRFLALNDAVARMDGIAKADHVGKTLTELLPQVGPVMDAHLRHVRETGAPVLGVELAGETQAAPGSERRWTTSYFPVTDDAGRVLGIGAMVVDVTDRVLAERALRGSEQRFAAVADTVPLMIWVTDTKGNVEFFNRAYREFYAIEEGGVLAPSVWRQHVHPDDLGLVLERIERAVGNREEFVAECRVRRSDGEWRWIMSRGSPRFADDGTFLGHVGSSPDITERKQAEEALRMKEAHLELLSDSVPALISYIGLDRRYRSCNRAYTTMLGLRREDFIGQPVRDSVGEEVWSIMGPKLEAAFAGETVEYEAQSPFPAGRLRWIRAVYTPHRDERGDVVGVIGMTTDITDAKLAQQALAESERRFRTMAEVSPVMIWVTDAHGRTEFVNRAHREFFGHTDEQIRVPGAWMKLIHPDDAPVYTEGVMAAVRERRTFEAECRVRHADGSWRWIATSAAPRFSESGEFLGHVGSSPEITALKRAEQALKEADRRKNEFLAILAHELRNPLAPIRSAVELLRVARDSPATIDQVRPMLERQVAHMTRLIEDLLDVSRIASGRIEVRKQPTALADIVRPVVEATRPAIDAAGLELAVSLPDVPCVLDVDPVRFSQVLSNLLHNAIKFTDAGGRIELTASVVEDKAGKNLVLSVRDTGVGIPAAVLPRIFELFVQGENGTRSREGLGIGLALARRLVELQGGSIEVHSEEGRGSVFTIRIPVLDRSHRPAATAEPADVQRTPPRVLIVDDNLDAAESLAALVRSLGSEAAIASSGEAGLIQASTFLPDVVLLDLGMPTMDGFETCRRLRTQEFGRKAFVVALTGRSDDQTRRKDPLRVGFNAQLTTPADARRLEQVLSRAQPFGGNGAG